jgi:hypothetical protein
MVNLNHTIAALDVLGTVVQAVPVLGEKLKSAVEIAKKTCEIVKVRILLSLCYIRSIIYADDKG